MRKRTYTAVVTGATRGIGYAITKRLLKDGMEVIGTGTETGRVHLCPPGTIYHTVDFLSDNAMHDFVAFLKQKKVDILVNNAGINKIGAFSEIESLVFDQILKVNLRAPFLLCQAVIPYMKQIGWGRIVNVTSIFGHISKEFRASYSASKFGLDGMTIALSAELSAFGILANSIGPGFVETELTEKVLGKTGIEEIKRKIPMKRLAQAGEIAALVSWLVSEENTYLTGQNLIIDGGFSRV